jgi:hypothetical protein
MVTARDIAAAAAAAPPFFILFSIGKPLVDYPSRDGKEEEDDRQPRGNVAIEIRDDIRGQFEGPREIDAPKRQGARENAPPILDEHGRLQIVDGGFMPA